MESKHDAPHQREGNFIPSIAVAIALYLSGFFVILTPLPFLYQFLRNPKQGLVAVALPSFVILILLYTVGLAPLYQFYQAHPQWSWVLPIPGMGFLEFVNPFFVLIFGLSYFAFFILSAWLMSSVISGHYNPAKHFLGASFLLAFLVVVYVLGVFIFFKIHPQPVLIDYFQGSVDEFILIQKQKGLPLEQLDFLKQNAALFVKYSIMVSPAAMVCGTFFVLVLNLVIGKKLFGLFPATAERTQITSWAIPFAGVWVLIAAVLGLFFGNQLPYSSLVIAISANVTLVLAFLYYLQGIAIVAFFLEQWGVRSFIKLLIYMILLLFFQSLGVLVVLLGFFDSWLELRKKILKLKTPNGS